jgi:hypothetical protein
VESGRGRHYAAFDPAREVIVTGNLLLWSWSADYDTATKRRKKAVKFSDITSQFVKSGDHPAIGAGNIIAFREAVDREFGSDEDNRPFVFYDHGKCAVVNYPNAARFELVPKIAGVGRRFGLNASEF